MAENESPSEPWRGDATERRLVREAQGGSFEAFERLVAAHQGAVYAVALRIVGRVHDAEEVVQQTFLSAVEHLRAFRQEARFGTWLLRIATNHALELLRKRSRRRTVSLADSSTEGEEPLPHPRTIAPWRDAPEQIASRRETRQLLDDALAELDEKHRVVFVLRDIEGLSTAETAEVLGISEANVKVRLLRARLMLRERLTAHFGDEGRRVVAAQHH